MSTQEISAVDYFYKMAGSAMLIFFPSYLPCLWTDCASFFIPLSRIQRSTFPNSLRNYIKRHPRALISSLVAEIAEFVECNFLFHPTKPSIVPIRHVCSLRRGQMPLESLTCQSGFRSKQSALTLEYVSMKFQMRSSWKKSRKEWSCKRMLYANAQGFFYTKDENISFMYGYNGENRFANIGDIEKN